MFSSMQLQTLTNKYPDITAFTKTKMNADHQTKRQRGRSQ